MKKLLIIHFSQDFTKGKSQLGGYGRIYNLCKDGNLHYIFTNSRKDNLVFEDYFVHENLRVVQFPFTLTRGNLFKRFIEVNRLSKEIVKFLIREKVEPDLLFGHSQLPNYFCLSGVKRLLKMPAPLIWEFNTVWGAVQGKGLKFEIAQKIICFFEKRVVVSADALVFQTESAKKWIEYFYSVNRKLSIVIPNAIHVIENKRISQSCDKKRKILVTGLFDSMNGLGLIVNLLRTTEFSNVEFHFYGAGPWENEIRDISDNQFVFYHGVISRHDIAEMYRNMDFILIPRLNSNEADLFIPSKLIEAMAYGLIPIITRARGLTEVVSLNEGILIDKVDADHLHYAINLATNLSLTEMNVFSNNSVVKVKEKYNWRSNYRRLNDFYSRIVV